MEEINDFVSRFDQPLVLWISGIIAAGFIFLLIFDSFRRRRKRFGGREPSQLNFFRRTAATFAAFRRELKRRNERNDRRRNRRK